MLSFFTNFKNLTIKLLNTSSRRKSSSFNNNRPEPINLNYQFSDNNQKLTPEEALTFGIFSRALQLITNDIAKVNFLHIRDNQQINSPLLFILNKQPSPSLTPWEFKKLVVWNLLLYGYSPILKVKNDKGEVISLTPIFPGIIQKTQDDNRIFYTVKMPHSEIKYNDDDIIWIEYEFIAGFENLSFLSLFKSTITKIKENEQSMLKAIKNDLSYSLFIKIPAVTNEEQQKKAQEALNAMIARQKQQGYAGIVIDQKWDIGKATDVLNMRLDLNTRNNIAKEFASILGIPPAKLGIEDQNKYNSSAELNKAYTDNALIPLLINICQRLSIELVPNSELITFRPIDLLSMDTKSIQELAASGVNNGYLTPNEVRAFLGLKALKDGDLLLINSTLVPLKNIEENKEIDAKINLQKQQSNNN
ncbi:phage portal protein, HK97 family [Mesomycoplasma conjunctivae]|uniref:phage portal protein n=1 Tax=Mesomycoplasma conjunctivae TaxID=45361 RepID=UPI0002D9DE3E|nr:phage portal protein [Mesomycoplasma conjunctivae]VEU66408.1 phage portal protein, HK97 family [Mesomycoplasma conjunctivae]